MTEKKYTRTQLITINALLTAIICLFLLVPIPTGSVNLAVIPLIAVIVSAEFLGLKNGLITGLTFGLISLTASFVYPTLFSQLFYNPMVSVVPRIFIGVITYLAMRGAQKLFPRLNPIFSYSVGAMAGVITNTMLVLSMIAAFYFGRTITLGEKSAYIGAEWFVLLITGNFLLEILICAVVTPPIVYALKKTVK